MSHDIDLLKKKLRTQQRLEFSSVASKILTDNSLYFLLKEELIYSLTGLQKAHFGTDYYKNSPNKDTLVIGGQEDILINLLKNVIPVEDWKDFNPFLNYSYQRLNESLVQNQKTQTYFHRTTIALNELYKNCPTLLLINDAQNAMEHIAFSLNRKECLESFNVDNISIINMNRNTADIGIFSFTENFSIDTFDKFIEHLFNEYDQQQFALLNNLDINFTNPVQEEEANQDLFENIREQVCDIAIRDIEQFIHYASLDDSIPNKNVTNNHKKKI